LVARALAQRTTVIGGLAQVPPSGGVSSRLDLGVELTVDHFVEGMDRNRVTLFNVYQPDRPEEIQADRFVLATGRRSENGPYEELKSRGASVEAIGDAVAPRGTNEAVYKSHRQARKL
jgi:hypothetical protein